MIYNLADIMTKAFVILHSLYWINIDSQIFSSQICTVTCVKIVSYSTIVLAVSIKRVQYNKSLGQNIIRQIINHQNFISYGTISSSYENNFYSYCLQSHFIEFLVLFQLKQVLWRYISPSLVSTWKQYCYMLQLL